MPSPQSKRTAETSGDTAGINKKHKKSNNDESTAKSKPSQTELQKSLLESDAELRRVFLQFLKEKPESIDRKQFVKDFWTDRQHLLRAHAAERQQDRGRYNVLSEVKPQVREGSMKIDFTQEQIQDIFRMHPVVRKAHSDLIRFDKTPDDRQHFKLELEFWQEFFRSRLCKKLRGLSVTDDDPRSPLLDRYLDSSEKEITTRLEGQVEQSHVPHFIDLGGNEQNHSQRKGNAPDETMRPSSVVEIPIIRRLNATSERILSSNDPEDPVLLEDQHAPVGLDENTWEELRLRDLQSNKGETGIRLNIRDHQNPAGKAQGQNHGKHSENGQTAMRSGKAYRKGPQKVLASLRRNKGSPDGGILDLSASLSFLDTLESDESGSETDSAQRNHHHTTKSSLKKSSERTLRLATQQIQSLIRSYHDNAFALPPNRRVGRNDTDAILKSFGWPGESRDFVNEIILTHQTTNEFLHYFWSLMVAQSPSMQAELQGLVQAMENNLQRMRSQAEAAEVVRKGRLQELKKQAQQVAQRIKRDPGVDTRKAGPSQKQVEALAGPLAKAVWRAVRQGKEVLRNLPAAAQ